MAERCPWCSGGTLDLGPCVCTELCGYDWCPAAARYVEAHEQQKLRHRVAAIAVLRERGPWL